MFVFGYFIIPLMVPVIDDFSNMGDMILAPNPPNSSKFEEISSARIIFFIHNNSF